MALLVCVQYKCGLSRQSVASMVCTSDMSQKILMHPRRASIAEILESKRVDPEMLLHNLGFTSSDHSLLERLPARFIHSQPNQALTDQFLARHPELKGDDETDAMAAVAEVFQRIPSCFHSVETAEPCTTLHKIVASYSPLARQQLVRQAAVTSSSETLIRKAVHNKRRLQRGQPLLKTINESTQVSTEIPIASSFSTKSLSSCDVTDESSDDECSPIVLHNRKPNFELYGYDQQIIINSLVEQSMDLVEDSETSPVNGIGRHVMTQRSYSKGHMHGHRRHNSIGQDVEVANDHQNNLVDLKRSMSNVVSSSESTSTITPPSTSSDTTTANQLAPPDLLATSAQEEQHKRQTEQQNMKLSQSCKAELKEVGSYASPKKGTLLRQNSVRDELPDLLT